MSFVFNSARDWPDWGEFDEKLEEIKSLKRRGDDYVPQVKQLCDIVDSMNVCHPEHVKMSALKQIKDEAVDE